MFGFEISNKRGQRIIYGDEMAYHYWGRVIISSTVDHNEKYTALFNIPEHWNPLVFATATEIGIYPVGLKNANYVYSVYHQNRLKIVSKRRGLSGIRQTFVFYVFVPAKYIPQSQWGFELYNNNGDISFTGYRPPLKITSFISNNTNNNVPTHNYNFAVPTTYSGFSFIAFRNVQQHFFMMGSSIAGLRKLLHTQESYSPAFGDTDYYVNIPEIPTINPDYYNQYLNLGNVR